MLRRLSWIVFAASLLLPFWWARAQLASFDQIHLQPRCGLPVLGIYGAAILAAGVLSVVAAGFSLAAFRRLPLPRSAARTWELALLSAPALLAAAVLARVLYGG